MTAKLGLLCKEIIGGSKTIETPSLSQLVPLRLSLHNNDTKLPGRWRAAICRRQLTRPSLALKPYYHDKRYRSLVTKTERDQDIYTRLALSRERNRSGYLSEGAALAMGVMIDVAKDPSAFARRAETYARMEIIARGVDYEWDAPMRHIARARRNIEAWLAQDDWLNAVTAMIEEGMLRGGLYPQNRESHFIEQALQLIKLAEMSINVKCAKGDRHVAVYVLQKAVCIKLRFSAELGVAVHADEVKRLFDLTAELGDDWSRHDRLRALAEQALVRKDLDAAGNYITEGVALWEQTPEPSAYSYFDWLGNILNHWIARKNRYSDDYDIASAYISHWKQFPTIQSQWRFTPLFDRLNRNVRCESVRPQFAARMASFRVPLLLR